MNIWTAEAWIAFLDVYGFSAQVAAAPDELQDVSARMLSAHETLQEDLRDSEGYVTYMALSDSLFLVYKDPNPHEGGATESLRWCVEDVCTAMRVFADARLPLRGGIAHGTVSVGPNLLVGAAVLSAVYYEKLIVAPLALLPERELFAAGCEKSLPKFPTLLLPVRDEQMVEGRVLYPYEPVKYLAEIAQNLRFAARDGPFEVAAAWHRAHQLLATILGVNTEP